MSLVRILHRYPMFAKLRLAYFTHSIRSDWNNGNAHFIRGLLRAMIALGHTVQIFEAEDAWSTRNMLDEVDGARSLEQFHAVYPELNVTTYLREDDIVRWSDSLANINIVILHEWTTPELAQILLTLRNKLGFSLMFHDTHHRASSSPDQIDCLGIRHFDGVIAFGNVLRDIYRNRFSITRLWTLHEAADVTVFHPMESQLTEQEVVWIGNWGDEERSSEIQDFLLKPATLAKADLRISIYGVRYPEKGLIALQNAGVRYAGYLPNLEAPAVYARSSLTVHIPRRQYATTMLGIPTIRVFEALACGIPLISAPWQDTEHLFGPGDLTFVQTGEQMRTAIDQLLSNPTRAEDQAEQGRATVLSRHTCDHRALELTAICREVLQ